MINFTQLTDVTMEDSNPSNLETRQQVQRSNEFKQALETRTLRFSFVDGHVQSICADQEEPVWVLNIKRGILSAFQNTMETLDEDQRVFEVKKHLVCGVGRILDTSHFRLTWLARALLNMRVKEKAGPLALL